MEGRQAVVYVGRGGVAGEEDEIGVAVGPGCGQEGREGTEIFFCSSVFFFMSRFAAGTSGGGLAVAVGFALLAMLEVILGQRQAPFEGEMNRVRRKGERKLVLNRPEFFKGADAAIFQLGFHTNIVLSNAHGHDSNFNPATR